MHQGLEAIRTALASHLVEIHENRLWSGGCEREGGRLRFISRDLLDDADCGTPKGGGEVTALVEILGRGVILQIIDGGSGISPDLRERVFDRFYPVVVGGQQGRDPGATVAVEHATDKTGFAAEGHAARRRSVRPSAR